MNKYSICTESHAAPGFLGTSGKSELNERFAESAQRALTDYFAEENMALPGPVRMDEGTGTAYVASPLIVYTARPV